MATRRVAAKTATTKKTPSKPKVKAKPKATPTKAKSDRPTKAKQRAASKNASNAAKVTKLTTPKPKVVAKSKAAPKPKPAPKTKAPSKRELLGPKVVALREEGVVWKEIARQLKIDLPSAHLIFHQETATPKQRKEYAFDATDADQRAQLAARVAKARDEENLGWIPIQARSGRSQATLKKLYTEHTGKEANQGFDVQRRQVAAKVAVKGGTVKSKNADGTKKATQAKRATARTTRKKATGSVNPSKG